jgi:two-component system nitrogen regulation sensor histidine kinase NtrY
MVKDIEFHQQQNIDARSKLEKSNQEISERKNYTEIVLASISAGVISVDHTGEIGSINGAAERLLNINAEIAKGKPAQEVLGRSLNSLFLDPILSALVHSPYFNGQVYLDELGRSEVLIVRARKLTDSKGNPLGAVIVFDDAQDQIRSQKVAAWKEVARRIAHEIKNPITPIKLNAQRLLRRFENQFEGEDKILFKKLLDSILTQVDSLRDLVNEFSTFSRLPEVSLKENSINDLIEEILALFKEGYPQVHWSCEVEIVKRFKFDRDQIGRVFMNLFGNSLAALSPDRPGEIGVRGQVKGNYLAFEVFDNGVGVPDSMKEKVLEPYVSTKSDGSGLGLSIVRQVLTDHGGTLRVLDNTPVGTIIAFEIFLNEIES